jgi:hypothetical protein
MSSIGSEVGGKVGGGTSVDQTQFPYFTSPGGVTPQQSALADYDYGQNLTEGQAQFGGGDEGGGNALSTMATQVAGGANIGKALNLAGSSDIDQGANYGAYENAINIEQQNQSSALAENEQNQQEATSLASLAGAAAGGAAGSGGTNTSLPSGTST